MRVMYWTLKRQKSMSSHAASISAWCAVFDWPSIVAAFSVCRHGPASSSAARRKTAARSSHGVRDQSSQASAAAAIARSTSAAPPLWTSARTWLRLWGMTASNVSPVLDVLAADHERDLEALGGELVEAAPELVALGAAGLVAEHRLVVRFGDLEDAVGAHCWRL